MPSTRTYAPFLLALILLGCAAPAERREGASAATGTGRAIVVPASAARQQPDKAGTELVVVFIELCLGRFPDRADLAEGRMSRDTQLSPMTADQVRNYLKDDPGRGWTYQTGTGNYVVTVEDPPYKACAVRRTYATLPGYRLPYHLLVRDWAATERNTQFQDGPSIKQTRGNLMISGETMTLPASDSRPAEMFMEIGTLYPDGQVEVRLVRQIPDPALFEKSLKSRSRYRADRTTRPQPAQSRPGHQGNMG